MSTEIRRRHQRMIWKRFIRRKLRGVSGWIGLLTPTIGFIVLLIILPEHNVLREEFLSRSWPLLLSQVLIWTGVRNYGRQDASLLGSIPAFLMGAIGIAMVLAISLRWNLTFTHYFKTPSVHEVREGVNPIYCYLVASIAGFYLGGYQSVTGYR